MMVTIDRLAQLAKGNERARSWPIRHIRDLWGVRVAKLR